MFSADDVIQVFQSSEWLTTLLSLGAKSVIVLATSALLARTLSRSTATLRHVLWCTALCSLLILPLFSGDLYLMRVPVLPASLATNEFPDQGPLRDSVVGPTGQAPTAFASISASPSEQIPWIDQQIFSWPSVVLFVWLIGVLLVLMRFISGLVMVRRLASRASELKGSWSELSSSLSKEIRLTRPVKLLRSDQAVMPMTCGGLSATVVLPVNADEWSADRRRVVLLHELIHVQRRDILTQSIAQIVCALYWFNPLVWWASKKMRTEQEWACDESVVATGVAAPEYARHLLEIARTFGRNGMSTVATTGMASSSQLQDRLCAVLNPVSRSQWSARTIGATAVLGVVIVSTAVVQLVPAQIEDETPIANVPVDSPRLERIEVLGKIKQQSAVTASIDNVRTSQQAPLATPTPLDQRTQIESPVPSQVAIDNQTKEQASSGFTAEERDRLASQGIRPAYIQEMADAGYGELTVDQLIQLFSNHVRGNYIAGLRAVGYDGISIRDLLSLKTNGITPELIKSYHAVKHAPFEAKRYVALVSNGVTPSYLKSLADTGYDYLTANKAIEFRRAGITSDFIGDARGRGYVNLSPNDLIELKRSEKY